MHPKFDFRYAYKFDDLNHDQIQDKLAVMSQDLQKMKKLSMSFRRNFRGMPFTPLMTKEHKLQVERKVVEVVGELYGSYSPLSQLTEKQRNLLFKNNVDIERNKVHDAAGINDDYPAGRGVFFEEKDKFVILVNFEDHLDIRLLDKQLLANLKQSKRLLNAFDRLGFATDGYLGYLTTSPARLGTGLTLRCSYRGGDR